MTNTFLCGVIEGFYGRPWTMPQRRELLEWMKRWSMNVYMYAPKDDLKMRAAWRVPYREGELTELRELVGRCRERDIAFVYTIAPGLDVAYADPAEGRALEAKIDGLLDVGVEHVCILFDDIPLGLGDEDADRFGTFAGAQAHVANSLFQHVRERVSGHFFFCPTDYCARMARPTVAGSDYLKELGERLHPEIEVFWTGPEIVSAEIPVPSIRELARVLGRKPLIWDNLHANDYDIRRVYLGPYAGRPSALRPEIRGVLTNPNNEFEANFVPLRTLAAYARDEAYEPRGAYREALAAWLPRFAGHGRDAIGLEELELLGDFFYLPFDHGPRAAALLEDARALLEAPPASWGTRLDRLRDTVASVERLAVKITELDNRDLLYSLHGYMWELRHELAALLGYLDWLRAGEPGGRFGAPDRLANTFRGGLAAELARLLPLDASGRLSHRTRP